MQEYYFEAKKMNDITEENRHAIYNHYFPVGIDELYGETIIDNYLFGIRVNCCIQELYAFHKAKSYTIDESSENFLLSEWMLRNDRVPSILVEATTAKYNEDMKRSLAHLFYDLSKTKDLEHLRKVLSRK